jgi:hypothetical protein
MRTVFGNAVGSVKPAQRMLDVHGQGPLQITCPCGGLLIQSPVWATGDGTHDGRVAATGASMRQREHWPGGHTHEEPLIADWQIGTVL